MSDQVNKVPGYFEYESLSTPPPLAPLGKARQYLDATSNTIKISSNGGGFNDIIAGSGGAVTSLTGTANQVIASASTGAVTLSLPSTLTLTGTSTLQTSTGNLTLATGGNGIINLSPNGTGYISAGANSAFMNMGTNNHRTDIGSSAPDTLNGIPLVLQVVDSSSTASGNGGTLSLWGQKSTGNLENFAAIRGVKENGVSNDTAGSLDLYTRQAGSPGANLIKQWSVTSSGVFQSNGAQTLTTSTGNLTIATGGGNGDLNLTPNGNGVINLNAPSGVNSTGGLSIEPATGIAGNFQSDNGGRINGDFRETFRICDGRAGAAGVGGSLVFVGDISNGGTGTVAPLAQIRASRDAAPVNDRRSHLIFSNNNSAIGNNTATNTFAISCTAALNTISSGVYGFASSATDPTTAADTGFSRVSAGVAALGNGTAGDYSGLLQLSDVRIIGTGGRNGGISTGGDAEVDFGSFSNHKVDLIVNSVPRQIMATTGNNMICDATVAFIPTTNYLFEVNSKITTSLQPSNLGLVVSDSQGTPRRGGIILGGANDIAIGTLSNHICEFMQNGAVRITLPTAGGVQLAASTTLSGAAELQLTATTGAVTLTTTATQPINFQTFNTTRWQIDLNGHLWNGTDGAYDIGSIDGGSTVARPRDVYIKNSILVQNGANKVVYSSTGVTATLTPLSVAATGSNAITFSTNGTSRIVLDSSGNTTTSGNVQPDAAGTRDLGLAATGWKRLYVDYTNTGTVGAVTINKAAGRVNIAAAGTSVVVTNSLVTAASKVFCSLITTDATATYISTVIPAAGSFTVTLNAAATAQVSIDFFVVNAD